MACWAYNRVFHLILLLAVVLVYGAFFVVSYYCWDCTHFLDYGLMRLDEWYFGAAAALFLIFWLLRGWTALECGFPWFHYTTLLLELVVQLATLLYAVYTQILFTTVTILSKNINGYIIYALGAVLIVIYFLLVFMYAYFLIFLLVLLYLLLIHIYDFGTCNV